MPFLSGLVMLAAVTAARGADEPAAGAVAAANTAFAVDLYRQLSPAPGNLIFSPYSLSDVLGMAQVGARGQTATEMAGVLHLQLPAAQIAAGFAGLAGRLAAAANEQVALVTANSLWVQPQMPLGADYLQLLKTQFRGEAAPVDFSHAAEAARVKINAWVADKTRGKIPELIASGALSTDTRMVLCNAVYFKGRWDLPFEAWRTQPAPFFLAPTRSVDVPTMHHTFSLRTVAHDGLRLLELPYFGRTTSMVILLPEARDGLAGIERDLTPEKLAAWLEQLAAVGNAKVALALPRFSATGSFDLGRQLKTMGMPAAFDRNAADFSGMTGDRSLFLSNVIHKAVVEVNEEGTVAAAASGTVYLSASSRSTEQVLLIAVDHPFLFLLRDNATGTILFLGRTVDPR
jgi:serpin B